MPSRARSVRIGVAIAPALLLVLVGCEQVLGLDRFSKQDSACDGASCDGGADGSGDGGPDVVLPDVVNQASSWAEGPMPSSAAEIEAGANPATFADFVPVSDAGGGDAGVLLDNVGKKLFWNLAASTQTVDTVEAAAAYCTSLGPGWRLPTRIELATLLDSTSSKPPFASLAVAPALKAGRYWTSSYFRPVSGALHYWFVDFLTGDVTQAAPAPAYVICTLGGT